MKPKPIIPPAKPTAPAKSTEVTFLSSHNVIEPSAIADLLNAGWHDMGLASNRGGIMCMYFKRERV